LPLFFIGEDIIIIQGSYRLSQIKSEKDTIILDFPLRGYQSGTIYIKFYNCFIISYYSIFYIHLISPQHKQWYKLNYLGI